MNFKKGITYKEFIKFLFPSILVMLSISIYTVVDGYFVSKYVGSNALAAINIILPINSVMFAVGLMFSAGGGALASIKLGENDEKTASKYFSTLLTIAIGFGIATMILALVFQDNLLNFLGANESLLPYAKKYSIYIILTLPLLMIKIIFAGFLRAEGNPKASLIMSLIGGFVNMILDFIFIVKLDMGISGAGLATLIGILSAIIYGARYFASKKAVFRFGFHPIDFKFVKNTVFNGSSEMVNELAVGFTIMIFNLLTIKHAGNDGVAAISVILYINFLISSIYIGFSIGIAPLLSYQYGAKNIVALKQIMGYARKTLLIISPLFVIVVILLNPMLVSIFLSKSNNAFNLATQGLYIFSFTFLFAGLNMYGSAFYTSLSNGKISAIIAFSKTFLFFSLAAYFFPILMGVKGIWLIMPIIELTTGIMVFYLLKEKQIKRFTNLKFDNFDLNTKKV